MAEEKPKYKFNKSMAVCADKLYTLRQERLAAQKVADELEAEEKALKEHIIQNLPKSEASGAAGKIARVTIVEKEIPQVNDWDKFRVYVVKNKAWHMIQKRLSDASVKEVLDDGKKIPGIEIFKTKSVSLNKV